VFGFQSSERALKTAYRAFGAGEFNGTA
jgi:hypothetical protein